MSEHTPERPLVPRWLMAVLAGLMIILILVVIAIVQPTLAPGLFPTRQEVELASDLRATYPKLCSEGFVIKDCSRAWCVIPAPPGAAEYEVSCKGANSQYGPALHVDKQTCKIKGISLTLASEMAPDFPDRLIDCPAPNP